MPSGLTQVSSLSNARRIQYTSRYGQSGKRKKLYDQVARPIDQFSEAAGQAEKMASLHKTGTIRLNYLSDMAIGTTALSEIADIVPQIPRDATIDVTTQLLGEAIQVSMQMMIEAYTNLGEQWVDMVALNAMESIDNLALEAALKGGLVERASAITSMDAGTAGDRATNDIFWNVSSRFTGFNVPGFEDADGGESYACITNPHVVHDIVTDGGDILLLAQNQRPDFILNGELGMLNRFRIVSSGQSKIFYGAGAANGSDADTTLSSASSALANTIIVASATNIAAGDWLNIISAKEASDGAAMNPHNERCKVASVSSTTITIVGQSSNGRLRFDHASGDIVNKDDSVHTMLFAGSASLASVWAPSIGRYGELVGPLKQGLAEQWDSLAWKHFGGYGRVAENRLYRAEVSVQEEA